MLKLSPSAVAEERRKCAGDATVGTDEVMPLLVQERVVSASVWVSYLDFSVSGIVFKLAK